MTITIYGYVPAPSWGKGGVPDISPYVTKVIYFMRMSKIPFEYQSQNLGTLDTDAPFGKLPYIIDSENGAKIADSNSCIAYLQKKFGDKLDADLHPTDLAASLAWKRMIDEHLYWSGIIEPRWRLDEGWEVYIPFLVPGVEVGPDLRGVLDAFRVRILDGFKGQGMGRRDSGTVLEVYKTDIDAISDYLGDKTYFFGDRVHSVDAALYSILRHLSDQPHKWPGTGYIDTKKNIVAYLDRMRKQYDM